MTEGQTDALDLETQVKHVTVDANTTASRIQQGCHGYTGGYNRRRRESSLLHGKLFICKIPNSETFLIAEKLLAFLPLIHIATSKQSHVYKTFCDIFIFIMGGFVLFSIDIFMYIFVQWDMSTVLQYYKV